MSSRVSRAVINQFQRLHEFLCKKIYYYFTFCKKYRKRLFKACIILFYDFWSKTSIGTSGANFRATSKCAQHTKYAQLAKNGTKFSKLSCDFWFLKIKIKPIFNLIIYIKPDFPWLFQISILIQFQICCEKNLSSNFYNKLSWCWSLRSQA